MSQLLITRQGRAVVSALHHPDSGIVQFHVTPDEPFSVRVGDIYVGQVENIVKNLRAAFVELAPGRNGYLDLNGCRNLVFANPKKTETVQNGDKILVQVAKEPVKTKPASLTTQFTLPGKYAVLLPYDPAVRISGKIREPEKKRELSELGKQFVKETGFGCLFRTNAADCGHEVLWNALAGLADQFRALLLRGSHGVKRERIYTGIPSYLADLRDASGEDLEKIRTDDAELFAEMRGYLEESQPEDLAKLALYDDEQISLSALYGIRSNLERALMERVWMKSGAYLIIQPTEALTVIDVNSGKAVQGKKSREETAFRINLEAARETAAQMRLRNLSGMILVDFINMKEQERIEELLRRLNDFCREDPVKTTVVDMTGLGLVELTRKRISRPLSDYKDILS